MNDGQLNDENFIFSDAINLLRNSPVHNISTTPVPYILEYCTLQKYCTSVLYATFPLKCSMSGIKGEF